MTRFSNRPYVGEPSRLDTITPTLTIRPAKPNGADSHHRKIAAFIYELAADLERLCEEAGSDIVVSPYASERRIVVETVRDGDEVVAGELLRRLVAEHDLAGAAS